MRLLGTLEDVDKIQMLADTFDIVLQPKSSATYTAAHTFELPDLGGSPPATEEVTTASATQTLQNKTFGDSTDATKAVTFDLAGATASTTTTLDFNQSANRVLTFPNITGNVLTDNSTATLSNKTIAAGSNSISGLTHGTEVDNPTSGVHGVSGSVVGTSDAQTLTNKTIDADNNTITNIDNADIKAAAGIVFTKMAALTASRATETNGSGFVVASSVTSTELGHLSGVTSGIQSQIDGKQADVITTRGDLVYGNVSNVADRLAIGASGTVLTSDGTDVSWQTPAGTGDVTAAANIADNRVVRGDGGAKGIQQSGVTLDDSDNFTGISALTMSGNLTIDSSVFIVDTTNNKVGINTASPNSYNANANDLVILDNTASGQAGLTIATTGGSGVGNIFFADNTTAGNDVGGLSYAHATDTLTAKVADTNLLSLTSTQFSVLNSADFAVNTATLFVDSSADAVGISTASPTSTNAKLHVAGDSVGGILVEANSSFTIPGLTFQVTNQGGGVAPHIQWKDTDNDVLSGIGEGGGGLDFYALSEATARDLNKSSDTVRMRIHDTGEISVNSTTLTEAQFNVSSGANAGIMVEANSSTTTPGLTFRVTGGGGGSPPYLQWKDFDNDVLSGISEGGGGLDFFALSEATGRDLNRGTDTIRMRINPSGQVGIGQTSPSSANSAARFLHIGNSSAATASLVIEDNNSKWEFFNNQTLGIYVGATLHTRLEHTGEMGIGVVPVNKLDVDGAAVIGSGASYAGSATAPSNGLLVEGSVGIGTTSVSNRLEVESAATVSRFTRTSGTGSGSNPVNIVRNTAATTQVWTSFIFQDGSANVNGTITHDSNADTTAYNTSSDARLKTNLTDFNALRLVAAMSPHEYERLSNPGVKEYGFVAQELYKVFPQAVSPGGEDPKSAPWCIDYGKLTGVLCKAIQELQHEITQLKEQLN